MTTSFHVLLWVSTILALILALKKWSPIPIFESNSVTLIYHSKAEQVATAKVLSTAIGFPLAELNTDNVDRFLFPDGTSVDYVKIKGRAELLYEICALKTIVLGFFSRRSPVYVAEKIAASLINDGYKAYIIRQPDPAFPYGDIVIVLSDAFVLDQSVGNGIIVRKHAFRMGGPRPTPFKDFPKAN